MAALLRLLAITLLVAGCGLPRDPEGTLERVTGSSMRVGVVDSEPWTSLDRDGPSGAEVELIRDFARELDAEIEWVPGAEAHVLEAMELGELDLAIGGFTADNPWSSRVSFSQPYLILGEDAHVMAVPHGENAWIVRLERYLRSRLADIPDLLERNSR